MSFWPLPASLRETVFPAWTPARGAYHPLLHCLSCPLTWLQSSPCQKFLSLPPSSLYRLPSPSRPPPPSCSWVHECMCGVHGWVHGWVGVCMGARTCGCGGCADHQSVLPGPTSLPVTAPSWVAHHLKIGIPLAHFRLSLQLSLVPALRTLLLSLSFPGTVWKRWARQAPCSTILGPLRNPSRPLPLRGAVSSA